MSFFIFGTNFLNNVMNNKLTPITTVEGLFIIFYIEITINKFF